MRIVGVNADVAGDLALPRSVRQNRRLFFYPGSSIGNFVPEDAVGLLSRIRKHCKTGGGLLIGADLVKSAAILERAYDDGNGITAAFNLNVLRHLNELVGTNFAPHDWQHRAFFNPVHSRVEMHLEARRDVTVAWQNGSRVFCKGERIHTENSYKYVLGDFKRMLECAGFRRIQAWTDDNRWFAVCHAAA
jgi:dimethylhistidine N-methyltransferase